MVTISDFGENIQSDIHPGEMEKLNIETSFEPWQFVSWENIQMEFGVPII